jgi:WG containing repeat
MKPGHRPYASVNGLGRVGGQSADRTQPISDGGSRVSAIAVLGGKAGVLDGLGRWLIAPNHDELRGTERVGYTNGLIPARRGELWGYIDMAGAFVIEPRYADAGCFTNERARVLERLPGQLQRIVVIDRRGNEIAARVTGDGLVVGAGFYGGWQSDHGCGW